MDNASFLDYSASKYHSDIVKGWDKLYLKKREYLYRKLKNFFIGSRALELGSADGIMTEKFFKDFERVTVVDGSKMFLDKVKEKVKSDNLELVCAMFEEFNPEEKYDVIFMTHILEHMDDPVSLLVRSSKWLNKNGRILIAVPNANSIHRLIGVKMGMLEKKDDLNEQDKLLGHRRVYTTELLTQHVESAGLRVTHSGGIMIKPISNRQIESQWSDELADAFFALGEDMPDLCSEIYMVAEQV